MRSCPASESPQRAVFAPGKCRLHLTEFTVFHRVRGTHPLAGRRETSSYFPSYLHLRELAGPRDVFVLSVKEISGAPVGSRWDGVEEEPPGVPWLTSLPLAGITAVDTGTGRGMAGRNGPKLLPCSNCHGVEEEVGAACKSAVREMSQSSLPGM